MPPRPTLVCRPAHLDPSDPFDAEIASMVPVYDHSIERTCEICDRPVLVGPRQQAFLEGAEVYCVMCGARLMANLGMTDADVRQLGNPQGNWPPSTRPRR